MINATNATGWNFLYDGQLIKAAFTLFDTALVGWSVAILFLVYQFMLYMKTRNLPLTFSTSLVFVVIFAGATFIKPISMQLIFVLLILELGGILYMVFWK